MQFKLSILSFALLAKLALGATIPNDDVDISNKDRGEWLKFLEAIRSDEPLYPLESMDFDENMDFDYEPLFNDETPMLEFDRMVPEEDIKLNVNTFTKPDDSIAISKLLAKTRNKDMSFETITDDSLTFEEMYEILQKTSAEFDKPLNNLKNSKQSDSEDEYENIPDDEDEEVLPLTLSMFVDAEGYIPINHIPYND